jgi:hypothetical protein
MNPGTLQIGEKFRVSNIYLANSQKAYLIGAVDEINDSVAECSEMNNTSTLNYATCQLTVTNNLSGAPGSLRWAIECAQPNDIILFGAGVEGDTIYIRDIDPITMAFDISIQGDLDANLYLAPHPDNSGSNAVFDIQGATNFEGLRFICFNNNNILEGILNGGSVQFSDSEIQEITISKSP